MKALQPIRWALTLALSFSAGIGQAAITTPYPFTAPGIVEVSYPYFLDSKESISIKKLGSGGNSYWQLTGSGSSASFWGPNSSYNLGRDSVKYVANFDAAGRLITSVGSKTLNNFLEIRGSLPAGSIGNTSWNALSNQLLLSATLLDSNADNNTPDLIGNYGGYALGFKTLFTGGWAANQPGLTGGSTGESLWLFANGKDFRDLVKALDGIDANGTLSSLIGNSKTINKVSSVASVPVPATAWLFGSGLMGLLGLKRRHLV